MEWISVKNGLPALKRAEGEDAEYVKEISEQVLVFGVNGNGSTFFQVDNLGKYDEDSEPEFLAFTDLITHWTPLTKPNKDANNEIR